MKVSKGVRVVMCGNALNSPLFFALNSPTGTLTFAEGNPIASFHRHPLWVFLTLVVYLPVVVCGILLGTHSLLCLVGFTHHALALSSHSFTTLCWPTFHALICSRLPPLVLRLEGEGGWYYLHHHRKLCADVGDFC